VAIDSEHNLPVSENVLNREFNPLKPNQIWGGENTNEFTSEGF